MSNVVCLAAWKNALYRLLILCDFRHMFWWNALVIQNYIYFPPPPSFFCTTTRKQVVTSLLPTTIVINYSSVVCLENTDFHYCRVDFGDQHWWEWHIQTVWKLSLILQWWGRGTGKTMMRKKVIVPKCKMGAAGTGIATIYVYFTEEGKRWDTIFLRVFKLCNDSLIKKSIMRGGK